MYSDHPNARGQKRHVEEKGPFGKSNKRKGSSRTRTATPAKRENPTLDGFEKAMSFTISQDTQSQQVTAPTARIQNDNVLTAQHNISLDRQPTQVLIFGYSTSSQWAALEFYERSSHGMICEDYARTPPEATMRYPNTFSSPHARRPLNKTEKIMAFRYDGGEHWVKVTFDSREAAERAIEHSPAQIYGHWVYAQLYHGTGPETDEAIIILEGEQELGRPRQKPQISGVSFAQRGNVQEPGGVTLPRSFTVNPSAHDTSPSSSTATSGTATSVDYPSLLPRHVPHPGDNAPMDGQHPNSLMMTHFPDVPRTILRPSSEAFLPQLTWWERQLKWLSEMGLIPGEVIGNGVPLNVDGKVDLAKASFYWRFFYWIDACLGTDICGLKDDD